jgi:hypothetical protein
VVEFAIRLVSTIARLHVMRVVRHSRPLWVVAGQRAAAPAVLGPLGVTRQRVPGDADRVVVGAVLPEPAHPVSHVLLAVLSPGAQRIPSRGGRRSHSWTKQSQIG